MKKSLSILLVLAILSTAFVTFAEPSNAPTFIYPSNGQILDYEGSYLFEVNPVDGSTDYLWQFMQNGVCVLEDSTGTSTEYSIYPDSAAHSMFTPGGDVVVYVQALIGNEWTEAGSVQVILSSDETSPEPTYTPTPTPMPDGTSICDQNQTQYNNAHLIGYGYSVVQTFTPSMDGLLSKVDVLVAKNQFNSAALGNLVMEITDTGTDGVPNDTVLCTAYKSQDQIPSANSLSGIDSDFTSFEFSEGIALTAGQAYGIKLSNPDTNGLTAPLTGYEWLFHGFSQPYGSDEADSYMQGNMLSLKPEGYGCNIPGDAAFKTYMQPGSTPTPEPTDTPEPTPTPDPNMSLAPLPENITVTNNYVGTDDTVAVTGLAEGDVVNIYSTKPAGILLGTATAAAGETSVAADIPQLGINNGAVSVTVTSTGKLESSHTVKCYPHEPTASAPASSSITVTNNVDMPDTAAVTGLSEGDTITVYGGTSGNILIGSATAGAGETSVTVILSDLGASQGYIGITKISPGKWESPKTIQQFKAEAISKAPMPQNMVITKSGDGTIYLVTVTALSEGDIINVYNTYSGGVSLASATASGSTVTASVDAGILAAPPGVLYITLKSPNKLESMHVGKPYYN